MGNNLSAFLEKIESDSGLRARLEALKDLPLEERQEGFLALSAELETPVSIADLKDFASQGEISDDLLEGVAGGGGNFLPLQKPKSLDPTPHRSVVKELLSHIGINL